MVTPKLDNMNIQEQIFMALSDATRLRTALLQIRKAVLNDSSKSYIDDVARRALEDDK
jgi:hypothetical protein